MKITETTLRGIIKDYIYRRLEFKEKMCWASNFAEEKIEVTLETKPNTQESLGYHLIKKEK
ncbi:unnamed protein product [marine sediment metagenome]|uniref:Uncharacterized protein n=1 Tax=marine sediment metagenome TaxID=412755 RepID=X1F2I8_9ZZZZ